MKNVTKLSRLIAILGIFIVGCDNETHPDPHLVEGANSQRQAQQPGQAPPTGPGK